MRGSAIAFSGLLHAAVVAAIWIGVPDFGDPMAPADPMPVEIVSERDFTEATRAEATRETVSAPEPEPEPESEPDPAPAPPDPDTAETPPAPEPDPAPATEQSAEAPPAPTPPAKPAPPAPDPEPAPQPESEPEPEPQPEPAPDPERAAETVAAAPPAPPRPTAKPRVQLADDTSAPAPDPEPQEDRLTSILKNVERDLKTSEPQRETPDSDAEPDDAGETDPQPDPESDPQPDPTPRASQQLNASQIDAVRHQLQQCWNVPAGARDAANLVVEIAVRLNRDGSVRHAEIATTDRMDDSFYRAAAESALRAVRICSPLEGLPVDKYDTWREMRLTFDPQEMF